MSAQIYMDYAAATPVDAAVFVAMQPYFSEKFYNPSATYLAAVGVKKDLETTRARVAGVLGSKPLEVTFVAGGTEANNLAIRGVMEQFPGKKVLVSGIEHDSVLEAAKLYNHHLIPVNNQGIIDVEATENLIDDDTVLVSVMLANNEVGSLQPIHTLYNLIEHIRIERKRKGVGVPIYLHTDACQAALYLDLHVSRLGVDMLTLNGGKMYGPKQSGMLYVKSGVNLAPQIVGGGQERGKRSGTENVAFAVGFAEAFTRAQAGRHIEADRLRALQRKLIQDLQNAMPEVVINGSQKHRLPNNVHITIPGCDNERVLFALDEAGILAAAGSACSASSDEPSHVLKAMGISKQDAQSSLRFTFGHSTDEAAIETLAKTIATIIKQ
ncbi:MAG: cysteine desulfurase family protein [Candidatus Saccharimonadales bacterium]